LKKIFHSFWRFSRIEFDDDIADAGLHFNGWRGPSGSGNQERGEKNGEFFEHQAAPS
jgi:hypothetical protein